MRGLLELEAVARYTLLNARRGRVISTASACALGSSTAFASEDGPLMLIDPRAVICTVAMS